MVWSNEEIEYEYCCYLFNVELRCFVVYELWYDIDSFDVIQKDMIILCILIFVLIRLVM